MWYLDSHSKSYILSTDEVDGTTSISHDFIHDGEAYAESPVAYIPCFRFLCLIKFLLQVWQIPCSHPSSIILEYENVGRALMKIIHPELGTVPRVSEEIADDIMKNLHETVMIKYYSCTLGTIIHH